MKAYKTPGTFIEEIPPFPPSIVSMETSMPVFIGYTEKVPAAAPGEHPLMPRKINSMADYTQVFGGPRPETGLFVQFNEPSPGVYSAEAGIPAPPQFLTAYALEWYFLNGGGPCYIVSVGDYTGGKIEKDALAAGLDAAAEMPGITLVLFPDAMNLQYAEDYYTLCRQSLSHCATMPNRFAILDVWMPVDPGSDPVQICRNADMGTADLRQYGAIYYPRIRTSLQYRYADDEHVAIYGLEQIVQGDTLAVLNPGHPALYGMGKAALAALDLVMPSSPAVAAKYVETDRQRGVWKSPANIGLDYARRPEIIVTSAEQDQLNIDTTDGKSINAIRFFVGRGPAIIWGARTLAGNDNEWRYVSTRRFISMVEASIAGAMAAFMFEPNHQQTWVRVKSMVENYLTQLWRSGALMGTRTTESFFVSIGLGESMTPPDLAEGRMIIVIGLAAVRPAEFIIIRLAQKMAQA